jgi:DNA polymerase III delta subunit
LRLVIGSDLADIKEADLKYLVEYLKKPSNEVYLLLYASKIDGRKKTSKELLQFSASCEAKRVREYELSPYIAEICSEREKSLAPDGVEFLKSRYGADLSRIDKEIEKASLYVDDRKDIGLADLEHLAGGFAGLNIFDIFSLLASKNKQALLDYMYKFSANSRADDEILGLWSMVKNRIKKLYLANEMLSRGCSDSELVQKEVVSSSPYAIKMFKEEARKYNAHSLGKMFKTCIDVDSKLKSPRGISKFDLLLSGMLKLSEHS